jgi:hypothetical protein
MTEMEKRSSEEMGPDPLRPRGGLRVRRGVGLALWLLGRFRAR